MFEYYTFQEREKIRNRYRARQQYRKKNRYYNLMAVVICLLAMLGSGWDL